MITCKHYGLILFFFPLYIQGIDTEWNGKFNIGREIVTSEGYGDFVTGTFCFGESDGSHIGYFNYLNYGLSRTLGCTFTIPFYIKYTENNRILRGLADLQFILQWHAYRTEDHMLLFKGGTTFPTGNKEGAPFLGTGSFNPIAYLTAIHSSEKLFASFVFGGIFTTTRKHFKAGSYLDYHLDIGPKFPISARSVKNKYIYFWSCKAIITFLISIVADKFRIREEHLILVGPSLNYDGYWQGAQLNFLLPICDRRYGIQPSTNFFVSFWLGWSF